MTQLFNQCGAPWSGHQLGTVPGTICWYGCLLCTVAAAANDSGHPCNPDSLNALCIAKGIYSQGDLLPDNVLDLAFPGSYQTTHYAGFQPALIRTAVLASDMYAILWLSGVYSPFLGRVVDSHFVMAWTPDGAYIGDPVGGVARALSAYGGSVAVKKTTIVKVIRPAPVVPPPPPPPAPPPPPPLYSVTTGSAVVATGLLYDAAVTSAHDLAQGHPGTLYAVLDAKGNTVDTEFRAPIEIPVVPPAPVPLPTVPSHNPTIWDVIDQILVSIVLSFKPHQ